MGEGKEFENQGTLAPCPSSADGHHRLNYSCRCNYVVTPPLSPPLLNSLDS